MQLTHFYQHGELWARPAPMPRIHADRLMLDGGALTIFPGNDWLRGLIRMIFKNRVMRNRLLNMVD